MRRKTNRRLHLPKTQGKKLRNKTSRRINFLKRKWKTSAKRNEFLKIDGHHILIMEDHLTHKFAVKIDDNWGKNILIHRSRQKPQLSKELNIIKIKGNGENVKQ
jgi:hypothetical protein